MTEKRSYDAIIIGGGVIGLASAWRLAQRGADVVVLERDRGRRRERPGSRRECWRRSAS